MKELEVRTCDNPEDLSVTLAVKFHNTVAGTMGEAIYREAARLIAERWAAEHYQEVVALVSPQAVATLVAAEAGAKIRESLEKDIPSRVETIVKRETWQRGVFGGMKKL